MILACAILTLGIITRFIVHVPNFTPIIALALFSGMYVKKQYAVAVPLLLMIVSDIFIGLHSTVFFTWTSIALIAVVGTSMKENRSALKTTAFGLFSAVAFFVLTNVGVWLMSGLYAPTAAGLQNCFVMAIPFFRSTLASTMIYSLLFISLYEVIAKRVVGTRLAFVTK